MIKRARAFMSNVATVAAAFRTDGYENLLTGLTGERTRGNSFSPAATLSEQQLKDLYDGNWLARRIVDLLVHQALRKPLIADHAKLAPFYRLNSDGRYPNGVLKHAVSMGRLFGGAVIVIGAVGTGSPLEAPLPLDEEGIPTAGDVAFFEVLSKYQLTSERRYPKDHEDPRKRDTTEIFKVTSGPLKDMLIHESRMIRCEGATRVSLTDDTADRDFPWQSVLQSVHETLGQYGVSWSALAHSIQEHSVAWLRLRGLGELLTSEDKALVESRMSLMSLGRSVAKTIFLDAGDGTSGSGEEFGRTSISFAGMAEVFEQLALQICGAAEYPATLLFGRAPAGMNATGESDSRQFYDRAEEYRQSSLRPKLAAMIKLATKSDIPFEFAPMWEPTAAEAAEIRSKQIAADQALWTMGVIEPNHILESRGRDGTLGLSIDYEKELAERAKSKEGPSIQVTPTDNAKVVTVNELRANQGKGPLLLPGGGVDPDGDLPLFVYEAKKTRELEALYGYGTNGEGGSNIYEGEEGATAGRGSSAPGSADPSG